MFFETGNWKIACVGSIDMVIYSVLAKLRYYAV